MVEICVIRPEDREALLNVVGRASEESFHRLICSARRNFSEQSVDDVLDEDLVHHVALVDVIEEAGCPIIVGGRRFLVYKQRCAELASRLEDAHQGQGIASALIRDLVAIAGAGRLNELHTDVLQGNLSMLKVFKKSGLAGSARHDHGTVHVTLRLR